MNRKIILGALIWLVGLFFNNISLSLMGVLLIFLGNLRRDKK